METLSAQKQFNVIQVHDRSHSMPLQGGKGPTPTDGWIPGWHTGSTARKEMP